MPKILIFKNIWIFVIYATDMYENRMHIHVGRKSTKNLCKIWLEPDVEISKQGDLNTKELNEVLQIVNDYQDNLIQQWQNFVNGKGIEIIKIK